MDDGSPPPPPAAALPTPARDGGAPLGVTLDASRNNLRSASLLPDAATRDHPDEWQPNIVPHRPLPALARVHPFDEGGGGSAAPLGEEAFDGGGAEDDVGRRRPQSAGARILVRPRKGAAPVHPLEDGDVFQPRIFAHRPMSALARVHAAPETPLGALDEDDVLQPRVVAYRPLSGMSEVLAEPDATALGIAKVNGSAVPYAVDDNTQQTRVIAHRPLSALARVYAESSAPDGAGGDDLERKRPQSAGARILVQPWESAAPVHPCDGGSDGDEDALQQPQVITYRPLPALAKVHAEPSASSLGASEDDLLQQRVVTHRPLSGMARVHAEPNAAPYGADNDKVAAAEDVERRPRSAGARILVRPWESAAPVHPLDANDEQPSVYALRPLSALARVHPKLVRIHAALDAAPPWEVTPGDDDCNLHAAAAAEDIERRPRSAGARILVRPWETAAPVYARDGSGSGSDDDARQVIANRPLSALMSGIASVQRPLSSIAWVHSEPSAAPYADDDEIQQQRIVDYRSLSAMARVDVEPSAAFDGGTALDDVRQPRVVSHRLLPGMAKVHADPSVSYGVGGHDVVRRRPQSVGARILVRPREGAAPVHPLEDGDVLQPRIFAHRPLSALARVHAAPDATSLGVSDEDDVLQLRVVAHRPLSGTSKVHAEPSAVPYADDDDDMQQTRVIAHRPLSALARVHVDPSAPYGVGGHDVERRRPQSAGARILVRPWESAAPVHPRDGDDEQRQVIAHRSLPALATVHVEPHAVYDGADDDIQPRVISNRPLSALARVHAAPGAALDESTRAAPHSRPSSSTRKVWPHEPGQALEVARKGGRHTGGRVAPSPRQSPSELHAPSARDAVRVDVLGVGSAAPGPPPLPGPPPPPAHTRRPIDEQRPILEERDDCAAAPPPPAWLAGYGGAALPEKGEESDDGVLILAVGRGDSMNAMERGPLLEDVVNPLADVGVGAPSRAAAAGNEAPGRTRRGRRGAALFGAVVVGDCALRTVGLGLDVWGLHVWCRAPGTHLFVIAAGSAFVVVALILELGLGDDKRARVRGALAAAACCCGLPFHAARSARAGERTESYATLRWSTAAAQAIPMLTMRFFDDAANARATPVWILLISLCNCSAAAAGAALESRAMWLEHPLPKPLSGALLSVAFAADLALRARAWAAAAASSLATFAAALACDAVFVAAVSWHATPKDSPGRGTRNRARIRALLWLCADLPLDAARSPALREAHVCVTIFHTALHAALLYVTHDAPSRLVAPAVVAAVAAAKIACFSAMWLTDDVVAAAARIVPQPPRPAGAVRRNTWCWWRNWFWGRRGADEACADAEGSGDRLLRGFS
ncbi:hypothetical protein M885DRAFT_541069 [Pelagophyceae sp. CCMP2097]|nr:hypothetical protein M885DRAFT_541069 [Pelagophyceae sp. CCMP2097]